MIHTGSAARERDSFDAWGRRRNADGSDWPSCPAPTPAAISTRGFTGHEMLDSVCLINMNGRIYDPSLGLFLSADTMVPNPFDRSSYLRYAYVNDNPLSFIDPSGHDTNGKCDVHTDKSCNPNQDGYPTPDPYFSSDGLCIGCTTGTRLGPGDWSIPTSGYGMDWAQIGGGMAGALNGGGGLFGGGWAGGGSIGIPSAGGHWVLTDVQSQEFDTVSQVWLPVSDGGWQWVWISDGSAGFGEDPLPHLAEFALEAAISGKERLQNAGKVYFRGKILPLSARGGQALRLAKLNQAFLTDAGELAVHSLTALNAYLVVDKAYDAGFSDRALAQAGVSSFAIGSAYFGGYVGLGVAATITLLDSAGAFDEFYDQFDNTPRL